VDKLLVTGVDGTVGSNLALALAEQCEVWGLYTRHAVSIEGCQTARCRHNDDLELTGWIASMRPQWVLHCGPWAASSWDSTMPELAPGQAGEQVRKMAAACAAVGARFMCLSTDAVFTGPRLFHEEKAFQAGNGPAATAAREAEKALAGSQSLVVRTHAYGWSPVAGGADFAERAWQSLTEGRMCEADADRHATPILASDLAELLMAVYRKGLTGVVHLAGAERTSPFRFAAELSHACDTVGRHVHLCDAPAHGEPRRYPRETSLATRAARDVLGIPMPMLREGLLRFAAQGATGLRDRFSVPSRELAHEAA
jgi:dTDP-4-dehydrorhamnose reductase